MNKIKITVHQLVIAASLTLIINILTIWLSGSVSLLCTKIQVSRLRNRSSIRPNIHLAYFWKTNLSKFAVIWAKRRQKVGYQWARIRSKITLTKEKVRRTRQSEEEERRRRETKQRFIYTLSFYNGYFGDSFWPKKKSCWTKKVHLVVTFSKLWLDIL